MSDVLDRWNFLSSAEAEDEILPCCGSRVWANAMASRRPFADVPTLLAASDEVWQSLAEADWLKAFSSHPRIGGSAIAGSRPEKRPYERNDPGRAEAQSAAWSEQEQRNVAVADDKTKLSLAEGNREYERRFNRTFIVCATGKSPAEILAILQRRLKNDEATELREAAEQQRQITQIRLRKWLQA
jgi:2-oxo-4-hydroxy-4-carboxy-5-ureidoimidazoline decarboxylase